MHKEDESTREVFEDKVFQAYFLSQIKRGPSGFLTVSSEVKDKATLLARAEDGTYTDEFSQISAMWFGWNLALEWAKSPLDDRD